MDLEEDEISASEQCLVDENEGKLFDFVIQLLVFVVITIQLDTRIKDSVQATILLSGGRVFYPLTRQIPST